MSSLNESASSDRPAAVLDSASASPATLRRATAAAALGAAAILVLVVLPAEAGVDPTGAGAALGLTGMAASASDVAEPAAAVRAPSLPTRDAIERSGVWHEDQLTIELAPHTGTELKARMQEGDSMVFEWRSEGGPVKVDMHGERPDAAEGEFTSYWEERELASAQGAFTAPYSGSHGWYWRNKGDTPVTVTVRTTGFYSELFRPGQD